MAEQLVAGANEAAIDVAVAVVDTAGTRSLDDRLALAIGALRVIAAPNCDLKTAQAFAKAGLDLAEGREQHHAADGRPS